MKKKLFGAFALSSASLIFSTTALAQAESRPIGLSEAVYSTSLSALTVLFVTAVILESAFSVIFNWRIFLSYFSSSGVKTIVMVVVSLVVVYVFNLDIVASLVAAYKLPAGTGTPVDTSAFAADVEQISGPTSSLITALVLAGGSAGVNNLLSALGFRSNRESKTEPAPPSDEAWVAVKVSRVNAKGLVHVSVWQSDLPTGDVRPPAIAGSVSFSRPSIGELLLRRVDRFPQNGGYVVKPNEVYRILVEGTDAKGARLTRLGDRYFVFAPRAIVDFQVEI
ncbi:hypothetical protein [Rhizobium phaseoli]|uniref:Uncharacterized protein n=1 Tax=Rhizobium phaseoli TaxID=396 RepID=A0ABN4QTE4_9HYPH|nr:hypothetical protein [Rhizobium phaseoli]ANL87883.1 hypothetical protein AMC81_PD00026 [Rhizobium phaseoli]ANL94392.1 hypothetical protein AMC80_PD00026 [Rhizobium phaseoli]RDJ03648.1 hypothetical protein B5K05_28110 [Rhizobium phaseoli]